MCVCACVCVREREAVSSSRAGWVAIPPLQPSTWSLEPDVSSASCPSPILAPRIRIPGPKVVCLLLLSHAVRTHAFLCSRAPYAEHQGAAQVVQTSTTPEKGFRRQGQQIGQQSRPHAGHASSAKTPNKPRRRPGDWHCMEFGLSCSQNRDSCRSCGWHVPSLPARPRAMPRLPRRSR